jgi:hypothetical protein
MTWLRKKNMCQRECVGNGKVRRTSVGRCRWGGGGCIQVLRKIAMNGALVAVLWRTEKVDAGMSEQQAER